MTGQLGSTRAHWWEIATASVVVGVAADHHGSYRANGEQGLTIEPLKEASGIIQPLG